MFTLIPTPSPQHRRARGANVDACLCSWLWESPVHTGLSRPALAAHPWARRSPLFQRIEVVGH